MYTGYGMNGTIVKPPYSTLTAYDLNNGAIKWQVPAGGDDPRAMAQGAKNTGYISQRTGIVTTSERVAVPCRRRRQAARVRLRQRPGAVDGRMPAGSRGIPAMYEVNGRQFLLVNATQLGSGYTRGQTRPGDTPAGGYVAYA